jgi:hypothetical protein
MPIKFKLQKKASEHQWNQKIRIITWIGRCVRDGLNVVLDNRVREQKMSVEEKREENGGEHVESKLFVLAHLAGLHGPPHGIEPLGGHDHYDEHGQVGHEVDTERDELAAYARQQWDAEREVGLCEEPVGAAAYYQHARVYQAQNGHVLTRGWVAPHAAHHQKREYIEKRAHYNQNGQHICSNIVEWLVCHFVLLLCISFDFFKNFLNVCSI